MRPGQDSDGSGGEAELLAAVRRFQTGEDREGAFRVLFDHYRAPVERFFRRRGASAEECRDLTQTVFLGIYQGLGNWRPEARFSTWVFKIATTTWLKRLRAAAAAKRRGTEVPREEMTGADLAASGLTERGDQLHRLLADERHAALHAAVHELPDQMRRCLMLRLGHDLKYREIACLMRLSIDTVKAHLYQARRRLEKRMAPRAMGSGRSA